MSMRDIVLVVVTVVAFAWLVTAHVVIATSLFARRLRMRALVGFVVAPMAPYYAIRAQMRVRAATWLVGCAVYVTALVLAWR
jgi:hypothetical protein